uniref:Uncharacterized protein n=1 Tax=Cacopsylla melanoneura TaxID=428564 RepID=A0A8D8XHR7_9HEMI
MINTNFGLVWAQSVIGNRYTGFQFQRHWPYVYQCLIISNQSRMHFMNSVTLYQKFTSKTQDRKTNECSIQIQFMFSHGLHIIDTCIIILTSTHNTRQTYL